MERLYILCENFRNYARSNQKPDFFVGVIQELPMVS